MIRQKSPKGFASLCMSELHTRRLREPEQIELDGLAALIKRVPDAIKQAGCSPTVVLWGVELAVEAEKPTDAAKVILLKFLRAKDYTVEAAFEMLVSRLKWQQSFGLDALMEEDFGPSFQGHDSLLGTDVEGRPLMISVFGKMDTEQVFGDAQRFLRWRIQLMERALMRLQPWQLGAAETIVQVHDYADCAVVRKDPRVTEAVKLFTKTMGDNYPEMKGRTIFINFPALFGTLFAAMSPFIPEKTRSKFVMFGPVSPSSGALLEYIPPHWLPERYGGLLSGATDKGVIPAEVLTIEAGEAAMRQVTVTAEGGGSVHVVMRLLDKDIRIEIAAAPLGVSADVSSVPSLLAAEQSVVSLKIVAAPGARLTFTFDNTYSRFTKKTLLFGVAA